MNPTSGSTSAGLPRAAGLHLATPARVRDFFRHCVTQLRESSDATTAVEARDGSENPEIRLGDVTLFPHQRDGAQRLLAILRRHGGALLADEVGLGKTFTALAVARSYASVLVVAPAAVQTMWSAACTRTGVHTTKTSYEQLSAGRRTPSTGWDLVILDEAHRARTPATRRYTALARLTEGAHVLLLSATPVHNRRRDLDALLALFLGSGAVDVDDATLGALIVRRGIDDVGVTLPALRKMQRHALPTAPEVLAAVRALPPPLPPADGGDAGALVALQLTRAWCSSDAALLAALRRRLATATAIEHALSAGRLPARQDLAAWSAAPDDSVQLAFPELVAPAAPSDDVQPLLATVQRHADALRRLRALVRTSAARDSVRQDSLRRILDAASDQQVVIFTHSTETAESTFRALRPTARVALLTGRGAAIASGPISREALLTAFAPDGIRARDDIARIDVLVASDVISEGVNLHGASVVIHLDLPWTVARFEQRLGRVRRLGSRHAEVDAHLILPPADADELDVTLRHLARKASLAQGTIGASTLLMGAEAWATAGDASRARAPSATRRAIADRLQQLGQRLSDRTIDDSCVIVDGLDLPCTIALVRVEGAPRIVFGSTDGATGIPDEVLARLEQLVRSLPPARRTALYVASDGRPVRGVRSPPESPSERSVRAWCQAANAERRLGIDLARRSPAHRRILRALAAVIARAPRARRAIVAQRASRARALVLAHAGVGVEQRLDHLAAASPPSAERDAADESWLDVVIAQLDSVPRTGPRPCKSGSAPDGSVARYDESALEMESRDIALERMLTILPGRCPP